MDSVTDSQSGEARADAGSVAPSSGSGDPLVRQETLTRYRQLLTKDPRNVILLNEVGLVAEAVEDNDRARWAYKRAIRIDPGYAQSYLNLGLLYRKEGREGPAAEMLQNYLRWAGDEADLSAALEALEDIIDQEQGDAPQNLGDVPIYAKLNQVWEELELTPAEALMLLDPDNSTGQRMMQHTLLDLVARGVLEADERYRVGRGAAFDQATLAPHEALFAKYFSRISDYVDIDRLTRAALAELSDDDGAYKAYYVQSSLLQKGYLEYQTKRILGLLPVQEVVPSSKGIRARNRLNRLLKEADGQMSRSLASNPAQATAYVEQGGPALLLMDRYPTSYFKKWHAMLIRMGFGPTIHRISTRVRRSELGTYLEDILKVLLGS